MNNQWISTWSIASNLINGSVSGHSIGFVSYDCCPDESGLNNGIAPLLYIAPAVSPTASRINWTQYLFYLYHSLLLSYLLFNWKD